MSMLGNLLDIVICNDINTIYDTKTLNTSSTSDHCMVLESSVVPCVKIMQLRFMILIKQIGIV
jgi:hypothetical protein